MAAYAMIKQKPIVASPSAMATSQQPGQLPDVGQSLLEFDTTTQTPATSTGTTHAQAKLNQPRGGRRRCRCDLNLAPAASPAGALRSKGHSRFPKIRTADCAALAGMGHQSRHGTTPHDTTAWRGPRWCTLPPLCHFHAQNHARMRAAQRFAPNEAV